MKTKALIICLIAFSGAASAQPDNVSLHLEFNPSTVYVDGEQKTSSFSTTDFENPFISSDQPLGLIGYRNPLKLSYTDDSTDKLVVYSSNPQTSFLVPFSTGGYSNLVRRENEISNNNFLDLNPPSFAFDENDPEVEVIYDFEYPVKKVLGSSSNIQAVSIRNRIDSDNQTQFILQTE